MGYITADAVKVIRNELKVLFPASQGWKLSVTRRDQMAVNVTVLTAPVNLLANESTKHQQVNQYWINDHYQGATRAVINLINDTIAREYWDASDIQRDHHNCAFYYNISIGRYDTDFEYMTPKNIKSKTKWSVREAKKRFKKQTVVNLLVA